MMKKTIIMIVTLATMALVQDVHTGTSALTFQQNGSVCETASTCIDTDKNGVCEMFHLNSLLHCNGRNYVSHIKNQRTGNCMTYSHVAAAEIMFGIRHDSERPFTADYGKTGFSPIDLSEGVAQYTNEKFDEMQDIIFNLEDWYAAPHQSNLEDVEYQVWWDKAPPLKMAEALESRYSGDSNYCNNLPEKVNNALTAQEKAFIAEPPVSVATMTYQQKIVAAGRTIAKTIEDLKKERFKPVLNCLLDAMKAKEVKFVQPMGKTYIPAYCTDTLTGKTYTTGCPEKCTSATCRYKPDFKKTDNHIKQLLAKGTPVITSIEWVWDSTQLVPISHPQYDFRIAYPALLDSSSFTPPSATDHNYTTANGTKKRFPGGSHSVLIVGYLENYAKTKTFWIVKNSHGAHSETKNGIIRDVFNLIRAAGDFSTPESAESTKRILWLSGKNQRYAYYQDLCVAGLSKNIDDAADIVCNESMETADSDKDSVIDFFDNCPEDYNPEQLDSDNDYVGDACDACPDIYDRYQDKSVMTLAANDLNEDGKPDLCPLHFDVAAIDEHPEIQETRPPQIEDYSVSIPTEGASSEQQEEEETNVAIDEIPEIMAQIDEIEKPNVPEEPVFDEPSVEPEPLVQQTNFVEYQPETTTTIEPPTDSEETDVAPINEGIKYDYIDKDPEEAKEEIETPTSENNQANDFPATDTTIKAVGGCSLIL